MQDFIKIHDNDNVIVAIQMLTAGRVVDLAGLQVTVKEDIPAGHKMAVCDIPAGAPVCKYGFPIGSAKEDIPAGRWVHTHNIQTGLGQMLEYIYEPVACEEQISQETAFMGFNTPLVTDGKTFNPFGNVHNG